MLKFLNIGSIVDLFSHSAIFSGVIKYSKKTKKETLNASVHQWKCAGSVYCYNNDIA